MGPHQGNQPTGQPRGDHLGAEAAPRRQAEHPPPGDGHRPEALAQHPGHGPAPTPRPNARTVTPRKANETPTTSADGPDRLDLATVTAVWNRRANIGGAIPADMEPQLRAAAVKESHRTAQGTLAGLEAFCLDPIERIRAAEHKPLQLRVARRLGMDIPRTLVTHDADAVRAFSAQCPGGM